MAVAQPLVWFVAGIRRLIERHSFVGRGGILGRRLSILEAAYVLRLQPLVTVFYFELYGLSIDYRFIPLHAHCSVMSEKLILATLWDYEAVTFGITEPLNQTLRNRK